MSLPRQVEDSPLFPDLLWARPERKELAGRLLIIGGSSHGFASTIKSYKYAQEGGIGEVKVVLPLSIKRHLSLIAGPSMDMIYVAATNTGSFARKAMGDTKPYLDWADTVLMPGELTSNAESTLLAEDVLRSTTRPIVLAGDSIKATAKTLGESLKTTPMIVASFAEIQRLAYTYSGKQPLLSSSTLDQQAEIMQTLAAKLNLGALTRHDEGQILVVSPPDQSSVTTMSKGLVEYAAQTAVLCAQFPTKPYEAATTAAILL